MQLHAIDLIDQAKRLLARGTEEAIAKSNELVAQGLALAAEAIEMQEAEKRKRML